VPDDMRQQEHGKQRQRYALGEQLRLHFESERSRGPAVCWCSWAPLTASAPPASCARVNRKAYTAFDARPPAGREEERGGEWVVVIQMGTGHAALLPAAHALSCQQQAASRVQRKEGRLSSFAPFLSAELYVGAEGVAQSAARAACVATRQRSGVGHLHARGRSACCASGCVRPVLCALRVVARRHEQAAEIARAALAVRARCACAPPLRRGA
jgi:hypothetical protein